MQSLSAILDLLPKQLQKVGGFSCMLKLFICYNQAGSVTHLSNVA